MIRHCHVTNIQDVAGTQQTYNIITERFDNYFANNVLVHTELNSEKILLDEYKDLVRQEE